MRYGISMADIPLTTGQPDRGAGAYQYTGLTLYDPLISWELDAVDRPGKMVPGLATDWTVNQTDKTLWIFKLRPGVKFHDGSTFDADAVIWNLEKIFNKGAPQFDTRQAAQVRPAPAESSRVTGRPATWRSRSRPSTRSSLTSSCGSWSRARRSGRNLAGIGTGSLSTRRALSRSSSAALCRASAPSW